jgi:hypothetical protein
LDLAALSPRLPFFIAQRFRWDAAILARVAALNGRRFLCFGRLQINGQRAGTAEYRSAPEPARAKVPRSY